MATREEVASSSESESWIAYRESESIQDASILPHLKEMLSEAQFSKHHSAIYFIIGALAKNVGCMECIQTLVSQCEIEKNKYCLSAALDALSKLRDVPSTVDLGPVRHLIWDKRWLVRHAAISALACAPSQENETNLLRALSQSNDPSDIAYAQASLNIIGTSRSLDALRANLKSRKRDVKVSAELAIKAIEDRR